MNSVSLLLLACICAFLFVAASVLIATLGASGYAAIAGIMGIASPYVAQYIISHFADSEKRSEKLRLTLERINADFDMRCDRIETRQAELAQIVKQAATSVPELKITITQIQAEAYSGIADAQRAIKSVDTALKIFQYSQDRIDQNSRELIKVRLQMALLRRKARIKKV